MGWKGEQAAVSLVLAGAGAVGKMLRKRSEAEGSEGSGEVGGKLERGAEMSLAQSGQDQSAWDDAREVPWEQGEVTVPPVPASPRGRPCQPRGTCDRGGGGGASYVH